MAILELNSRELELLADGVALLKDDQAEALAAILCAAAQEEERKKEPIDSPRKALLELGHMAKLKKEHFVALYLDATHRVLYQETISVGTLTASLVHPREVFAPALERPAAALIIAHNHPSGDPAPSREDREMTRRLCEAGRILGLPVLDHLIVASKGYFSFRERGLLDA